VQLQLPFGLDPPNTVSRDARPLGSDPPSVEPERIQFVRVRRARRYVLRVGPDGTLRVTVPRGGSRREAQEFIERNRRWIERERRRVREEHAPVRWFCGHQVLLRGVPVTIDVQPGPRGYVVSYGGRSVLAGTLDGIREAVERDLRELARIELVPRLYELAAQHGLTVQAVSIRNQRSRWGSCGRSGHIALNFRLVQMPTDIRDYVLVHELMHLRQQNHGRRFWRFVQVACPYFREAERWLRTKGRSLF
jgi:predicted metal-dependent hydrolase